MDKPTRGPDGRFLRGGVGNPKGRPRSEPELVRQAQLLGPQAVETLAELMTGSNEDKVRLSAAEALLARGYGKPRQQTTVGGEISHVVSLNQLHLAAIRDLSKQALNVPALEHVEDATLIEPTSSESKDAQKLAYSEKRKASEPAPKTRSSLSH